MKRRSETNTAAVIPPQPPPPERAQRDFGNGITSQWTHCGITLGAAVEVCPKCHARKDGTVAGLPAAAPIATAPVTNVQVQKPIESIPIKTTVEENPKTPTSITNNFSSSAAIKGDTIEVTLGEQLFAPVEYFSFRIGPYKASAQLQAGDDPVAVGMRLATQLKHFQELDFTVQLRAHLKMVKEAHEATRAVGLGR